VMASHGRRGILAVVLGSETVKVLTTRRSRCWCTAEVFLGVLSLALLPFVYHF